MKIFNKSSVSNNFKRNGFCSLGQLISDDDIAILSRECKSIMSQQAYIDSFEKLNFGEFRQPVVKVKDWHVLINFIGLSNKVDLILEKLVSSHEFKSTMESFFGEGYKLWQFSLRLSTGSDDGLGLHTDAAGESGVAILLDDILTSDGATVVLPGSHKFPLSSQELMTDSVPIKFLKPFLTPITGKKGSVFIFSKKTYHGRLPNHSGNARLVILFATFSVGYEFNAVIPPKEVLDRLGPELNKLFNQRNLIRVDKDTYRVVGNDKDRGQSFIDELYLIDKNRNIFWNLLKIYPLFVVKPVKWLKNILRGKP